MSILELKPQSKQVLGYLQLDIMHTNIVKLPNLELKTWPKQR